MDHDAVQGGNVSKMKTLDVLRNVKPLKKEQLGLHTNSLLEVNILQSTNPDLGPCGIISYFACSPFHVQFACDAALRISIENARNHTGTLYLDITRIIVCHIQAQTGFFSTL